MGEQFRSHYSINKSYVAIHYGIPSHLHDLLDKFQQGKLDIEKYGISLFYGKINVPIFFNDIRKRAEVSNTNNSKDFAVKESITNFYIPIVLVNQKNRKFYIDLTDVSKLEENLS